MMYPDQLLDKPPPPYLVKWSDDYKMWDEVPIKAIRYTPMGLSDEVTDI